MKANFVIVVAHLGGSLGRFLKPAEAIYERIWAIPKIILRPNSSTYSDPGVKSIWYQRVTFVMVEMYRFLATADVLDIPVLSNSFPFIGSDISENSLWRFDRQMPYRLATKYFSPLKKFFIDQPKRCELFSLTFCTSSRHTTRVAWNHHHWSFRLMAGKDQSPSESN